MSQEFGNVSEIVLIVEALARSVYGSTIALSVSYGEVAGSDEFVAFMAWAMRNGWPRTSMVLRGEGTD